MPGYGLNPEAAGQELSDNGYNAANPTQVQASGQNINSTINTAGAQPSMATQQQLMAALQARANGTGGPTVAQNQLQTGTNTALANALAAGASATRYGQNPGAAAKQIGNQQALITSQAANNAANLRAGEINSATVAGGNLATSVAQQQLQEAQTQEAATQTAQQFEATQAQQAAEFNVQQQVAIQNAYNQAVSGLTNINQQSSNALFNGLITGAAQIPGQIGQGVESMAGAGAFSAPISSSAITPAPMSGGVTGLPGSMAGLGLAEGGEVSAPGTYVVGEHGPEIAHLEPGSMVAPLNPSDQKPGKPKPKDVVAKNDSGMAQPHQELLQFALKAASGVGHLHDRVNKLESALKSKNKKRA
jgi:hypothetical protein